MTWNQVQRIIVAGSTLFIIGCAYSYTAKIGCQALKKPYLGYCGVELKW